MKSLTTTLITILTLLNLTLSIPLPHPTRRDATPSPSLLEQITDGLLYDTPMSAFQSARAAKSPAELDWNSNGCSYSPDKPFGNDFTPACQRHDFGYHNTKDQHRFNDNKDRIDSNFKKDMDDVCEAVPGTLRRVACRSAAWVYYKAVKTFGGIGHED